jgi:hypothetical protein
MTPLGQQYALEATMRDGSIAPITVIGQASIELVKSTHVRHPRNIILRPKAVTR